MRFEEWILNRIHEDNEFGDLAKDYYSACQINSLIGDAHERLTHGHLSRNYAIPEAHATLSIAKQEYFKEKKNGC